MTDSEMKLAPGSKAWILLKFLAEEPQLAAAIADRWRSAYPDDPDGWMNYSSVIFGRQEERGDGKRTTVSHVGKFDDRKLYEQEILDGILDADAKHPVLYNRIPEADSSTPEHEIKRSKMRPLKRHRGDWVKDEIIRNLQAHWAATRAQRNALPTLRRMMDFQRDCGGLARLGVGAERLAEDLGAGIATIKRHIKTLLDGKLIVLWQRGNNLKRKTNQYILNVDQFVLTPKSDTLIVNFYKTASYCPDTDWANDPYGFQKRMDELNGQDWKDFVASRQPRSSGQPQGEGQK